jgi:hypothetical protein
MKKLVLLILLGLACSFSLFGQTGQWAMNVNTSLYNPMSYEAYRESRLIVELYPNGVQNRIMDVGARTPSYQWTRLDIPTQTYSFGNSVQRLDIYTKLERNNGGDPPNGWKRNLPITYPNGISYTWIRYSNEQAFFSWQGHVDLYYYPINVSISNATNRGDGDNYKLLIDEKITVKAPTGYGSSVYKWVYSTDGTNWKDIANSAMQGNPTLEASGIDIYGLDQQGLMDTRANTWIALEYEVYQSRDVPRTTVRTSPIIFTNQRTAPKILSIPEVTTKCSGTDNAVIKVILDRALRAGEELRVFVRDALPPAVDLISLDVKSLDSENAFYIPNMSEGVYSIQIAGFDRTSDYQLYSGSADHKKDATVNSPDQLFYSILSTTVAACAGENSGSISLTATGGTKPYKAYYRRNGTGSWIQANFAPNSEVVTLSNLYAGNYDVHVIDANGCEWRDESNQLKMETATISEPEEKIFFELMDSQKPSGYNVTNGFLTLHGGGGTPPYQITWQNSSNNVLYTVDNESRPGMYSSTLHTIAGGRYTVLVRDSKGCQFSETFYLEQPPLLVSPIIATKAILCRGEANGELTANASGGVLPSGQTYTYKWYKKENGIFNDIYYSGQTLSNLSVGQYKVEVWDRSSTQNYTSAEFNLTEPALLTASFVSQDATCFALNNGILRVTAQGGSGDYRVHYKLKTEDTYQTSTNLNVTTLLSGHYDFYVTDRNNCIAFFEGGEQSASTYIGQPDAPLELVSFRIKTPSGHGRSDGQLYITMRGGTPKDDDTYTVEWRDENSSLVVSIDSLNYEGLYCSTINNLPKGKYTVEIKDKNYSGGVNACFVSTTFDVIEPDPLVATLEDKQHVLCYGDQSGEIVAHVTGGVTANPPLYPYIYRWYQIVDGVESLLPNQNDSILRNIPIGQYKVKIVDGSYPVNETESGITEITQPPLLVTEIQTKDVSCFEANDGYIRIKISGGVGGYRLYRKRLQDENEYTEYSVNAPDNTFYLENIFGGDHSIFILDANGCYAKINGEDIHVVKINQPLEPLHFSVISGNNVSGYGKRNGYITVNINGGTPKDDNSYTVEWKDESGNLLTASESVSGDSYESQISNLAPGVYYVEVKDKNYTLAAPEKNANCLLIETFTITEPDELIAEIEQLNEISCFGMSDGFLNTVVSGGVRNPEPDELSYQYVWYREGENGYTVLEDITEEAFRNAPAGNYRVVITDHSWLPNYVTLDYNLTQPELLTAKLANLSLTCGESASLTVEVEGGTPPYRFEWNTGDETQSIQNVAAGQYLVYVTDSKGCDVIAQATVYIPDGLDVEGTVNDPLCFQGTNGSIELQVVGGVAPYTYQWSTGATSRNLTNVGAGNYTVRVTDQGNCSFFHSFTLTDPEPISVDLGEDRTLCLGQRLKIAPEVEDPKTKFYWTGPNGFTSTDPSVTVSRPGTYRLLITDSNGCQATDELIITGSNELVSAEMVVASNLFLNDTIMVVNISSPHSEQMEWLVEDLDAVEIVEETEHFLKVVYKELGYYSIGLRSYTGDCYEEIVKSIHVTDPDGMTSTNFGESIIRKFELYPNMNNGVFTIDVELTKISPIRVRIINLGSGVVFDDRTFRGEQEYSIPYNLSLTSGVYVVLLETASGHTSLKMIVN